MKNTDTRERVLKLLFNYPLRGFHVREISRLLKISPPAISKAIKQLEKENLISISKKFLYEIKANLENQEFRNMKRVHNLKSIYDSGLFSYLKESSPLGAIILFGSYSRGDDTEKSDIDIAIEGKDKKLILEEYEKKLNRRINIEFIEFRNISKELKDNIINGIILSGYIKT